MRMRPDIIAFISELKKPLSPSRKAAKFDCLFKRYCACCIRGSSAKPRHRLRLWHLTLVCAFALTTIIVSCDKKKQTTDSSQLIVSSIPWLLEGLRSGQFGIDSVYALREGERSDANGALFVSASLDSSVDSSHCVEINPQNRFFPDSLTAFWGEWQVVSVSQPGSSIVFPDTRRWRREGPVFGEIDEHGMLKKLCF